MGNFSVKKLKMSARAIMTRNYKHIGILALISILLQQGLMLVFNLLPVNQMLGVVLSSLLTLMLTAPVTVGVLNGYVKMIAKQEYSPKQLLTWYTEPKRLGTSVKTIGMYTVIISAWAAAMVLFPLALVYIFWGSSLMSGDTVVQMGIFLVTLTGIMVVAIMPLAMVALQNIGGIFMAAKETHLKVSMAFSVSKDFVKPHIYRFALMMVTFLPLLLLGFFPQISAVIMAFAAGRDIGLLYYPAVAIGTLFLYFYVYPYMSISALLMFERMREPKKNPPYDI